MTAQFATQPTKLIELDGYEGEGEWYKPFEMTDAVGMLELLTVDRDGVQMAVTGRLVDDDLRPITFANSTLERLVQVGVDPFSNVFQIS